MLCDGLYSDCDVFWKATDPRHERACEQCQLEVRGLVEAMGMPHEWLGRYLGPDERSEARTWVDALARDELRTASYGDWQVAEWITSSVHSHFRTSQLELDEAEIEQAFRSYLFSGLVACFGLSRLLDDYRPDTLFLFNGRQSSTRVAFELARARGVRLLCHERGGRRETLALLENENFSALEPLRRFWHDWAGVALVHEELEEVEGFLRDRERGRNLGWRTFTPPPQPLGQVRAELGLEPGRPLWAVFTSSDDEVAAAPEWRSPFGTQQPWLERTVDYARRHPELDLVIRVHPNTGSHRSFGANASQLRDLEELGTRLPQNARMVMPDDELSSYSLMELADVGLVYISTVGLELACKGKTVVVAGSTVFSGVEFVRTVEDAEDYEELLDEVRTGERDDPREIRRLAYRFAHGFFLRADIRFPLVRMPTPHTGELAYSSLDELAPGRDGSLDRIARIVLEGEPITAGPSEAQRARTDADERDFFLAPPAPRVSVVIPCFNYGRYLEKAVESLLAQTFQDVEVIVVDDGSTDDSLEVARRLEAAHPQVSVLAQPNAGQPAIARNNGIALARGEYVLCLDADDHLHPRFLEECVAALDDDPSISIAYGDQQNFGADDVFHVHPEYDFARLARCNLIGTASVFRRAAWEDVGGYRTNVRGYEDWDFWVSCGERGHHGKRVQSALWYYRSSEDGLAAAVDDRDQRLKAQVVLNHPRVYTRAQLAWARGVLTGDPASLQIDSLQYHVPAVAGVPRAPLVLEGARSYVTLVHADEAVASPELLAAYAGAFSAGDDATLVVYGAGDPLARLEPVAAQVGLDGDSSADVLVVPVPDDPLLLLDLVRCADAVLSRDEGDVALSGLPRFDDTDVLELRRRASRSRRRPLPKAA